MAEENHKWVIVNDFGEDSPCALSVKLEGTNYEAFIKWDGCVDFTIKDACKGAEGMEDEGIHICDIPRFVEMLQSLEKFRMNNIANTQ